MRWASIPDYPEYEISEFGVVKSKHRNVTQISRWGTPMTRVYVGGEIKQKVNKHGYAQVVVRNQTHGSKTINIHRLVAELFVEGYAHGLVVNHKDGNKLNNKYSNLEWVTVQRNIEHAFETGLSEIPFGIESNACKGWVEAVDSFGNVVANFAGEQQCRSLGFTPAGVSSVLTGRQKKHRGLIFRWKEDLNEH